MLRRTSTILITAIVTAAFAASIVAAAVVGPRARMGARPGVRLHAFSKALALTPEQTENVKAILLKLRTGAKAVLQSDRTREAKRQEILELRGNAKADIYAVLTPEQKAKADQTRLVDRLLKPKRGSATGLNRMLARLDLTPEQKTSVQSILKDTTARVKDVRQDTNLSPEAKKTRLMEIRKGVREDIMALLTPEQKAKIRQWTQNRRGCPGQKV